MYEYLQYNGIPEDKLLIEDQSSDTVQNIEFSRTVIDRQEYNKAQAARAHLMEFYRERPDGDTIRIGILTSNYHVFRAEAIARRQEIEPVGVAAACDPVLAVHLWLREAFARTKRQIYGKTVKKEEKKMRFNVTGHVCVNSNDSTDVCMRCGIVSEKGKAA